VSIQVRVDFPDGPIAELEDATVVRVELWQAISEPFTLTIALRSPADHIDMRQAVARRAEVRFFKDEASGVPHSFLPLVRGMVRRGRQLSREEDGLSTYELVVVPPLWLLSLATKNRIFSHQSAPDMARALAQDFQGQGVMAVPVPRRPSDETRVREYTVQYREDDLTFMQRVLAEDGVAFYFDGEGLEDVLLVANTAVVRSSVHASLPTVAPGGALHGEDDVILDLAFGPSLEPGVQSWRDYSFQNHLFHPEGRAEDDGGFELVDLVGAASYEEGVLHESTGAESTLMSEDGRKLQAATALEARRRRHDVTHAELSCPLPAGAVLSIEGDHAPSSRDQLVIRAVSLLELDGELDGGRLRRVHRVECIPADYPYRPPRVPKPRVHGLQRGTVVGRQEIDVDEHGRVLVLFQWDERKHDWKGPPEAFTAFESTRRIQVAQDWAGPNRGFVTLPRLGDEVVIAYIDGDPDQPVIVGQLYNGLNRASVTLPDARTQSVWRSRSSPQGDGFHEIRFEDQVGSEELHIEAERLHTRLVKGSEQINVGGDRSIEVGGDQDVKIVGDLTIEATNIAEQAKGTHLIEASTTEVKSSSRKEATKGAHAIDAGRVVINAGEIVLQAGGSVIRVTDGGILIQGPAVDINP